MLLIEPSGITHYTLPRPPLAKLLVPAILRKIVDCFEQLNCLSNMHEIRALRVWVTLMFPAFLNDFSLILRPI